MGHPHGSTGVFGHVVASGVWIPTNAFLNVFFPMFSTRVAKGTMARQLRKNFQTFLGISRTSMESFWMAISGVFTELTKRLPFDLSMRPSWSSRAGFLSFGCVRSSQGHRTHHALHEFTSCFKIQFVQLCNFVHQKSSTWHQKSSTNSSRRGQ